MIYIIIYYTWNPRIMLAFLEWFLETIFFLIFLISIYQNDGKNIKKKSFFFKYHWNTIPNASTS